MKLPRAIWVATACAFAGLLPAAAQNAQASADGKPALVIHMKDSYYKPDSVQVRAGEKVVFVNDDEIGHTVTSADRSFDSNDIGGGKSWQFTFTHAGTYAYVCIYHPWMKGNITVTAAPSAP